MPADLTIEKLSKDFPGAESPVRVLKDVNLALSRGESLAITGPSGSGKSTLLYIIGTLDQPTSGTVNILGSAPFTLGATALARFRNQRIGFVFQDHCLLPQCTLLENVVLPALAGGGVTSEIQQHAMGLLERVGLAHRKDHRPGQLSGGEKQRAAICRALINRPGLVLADEPTGNLDQATAETVGTLLLELCREQQVILVVVTHSPELADRFARHAKLHEGSLVEAQP